MTTTITTAANGHGLQPGDQITIDGRAYRVANTASATTLTISRLRWYHRAWLALREWLRRGRQALLGGSNTQQPAPFDLLFVVLDGLIYIQPKPSR